ncbi:Fungal Zn(2)-Cys(6) binuclear cluster domain-containing protein [Penicillium ucsense]|uniref:Fungal Zn(2)-Cys(6) binuclear cluster domain-containing protein n=1 Tax=Penicillium ucsense TaxID=2839758 RepID=A0A8J8W8A9_9EURO|nr:Fungal Zn(2)-Cys(6) binuclear cluster domain-containing protein [Penicillium ucsense]KAF7735431.1 Fungal Zn(2)-Cys(6) binuclear cluster domain-containing protein [Penicillium ucsense]
MDLWAESNGPPRKKIRKGTKSCIECRRRKIRCTYDPGRSDACHECRLRGSSCIDQAQGTEEPAPVAGYGQAEQRYSLRERVAHLESVVQELAKRVDQQSADDTHPKPIPKTRAPSPVPDPDSDQLGPSSDQIRNAPVLQLFDNYVVSRREDTDSNDRFAGAQDTSSKACTVRAELLALLPPAETLRRVIAEASHAGCLWDEYFPSRPETSTFLSAVYESAIAPAELAKVVLCLAISVIHLPPEFDLSGLHDPLDPQKFSARCNEAVDRLVVRDDDFAATLPGIEAQTLLAKSHLSEGRLRKAWLVNRRAIEFAYLAGMHFSTRTPRPTDTLFDRRLKIWCSVTAADRTLSMILGLPYGAMESFFKPQVERRLQMPVTDAEQYFLRMSMVAGHIVDRNHDFSETSFEQTLALDQELMDAWKNLPESFFGILPGPKETRESFHAKLPLQLMLNVVRALLHMPFLLKFPQDQRFSVCHREAIQSARNTLMLYKVLRSMMKTYLCKMIDFFALTMGMMVIVYLHGHFDESPALHKQQDDQDWRLIGEVADILGQAANEAGGTVAAQSALILTSIVNSRSQLKEWASAPSCKVTIPYFGSIVIGAGPKVLRYHKVGDNDDVGPKTLPPAVKDLPSAYPQSLYMLQTSPFSEPELSSATYASGASNSQSPVPRPPVTSKDLAQPLPPGEDPSITEFAGFGSTSFTGLFNDLEESAWLNLAVDHGLDYGWNVNWFD